MSVGAIDCHRGPASDPSSRDPQFASAESLGDLGNGQTDNNMRRLGDSGCTSSVMALIAKPVPKPKAEGQSNLCYTVQWQVNFIKRLEISGEVCLKYHLPHLQCSQKKESQLRQFF